MYETLGQLCEVMLEELFKYVKYWRGDIAYDLMRLSQAEQTGKPVDFRWFLRPTGTFLVEIDEPIYTEPDWKEYIITYQPDEGFTFTSV